MGPLLLAHLTGAAIVFCADGLSDDITPRPTFSHRLVRATLWPLTLTGWFTHRSTLHLTRVGAILWFATTTGWLMTFIVDRAHHPVAAMAPLAFVCWCVDGASAGYQHRHLHRLLRALCFPRALYSYATDPDAMRLLYANLLVWILLTGAWLISLEIDRIAAPFGMQ